MTEIGIEAYHGYPEEKIENIFTQVKCRKFQLNRLLSLMGEKTHFSCPSIFIYGVSATGKTYTVQTILKTLKLPTAFINCIETYSSRLLFESILNQLSGVVPSASNDFTGFKRCDNMNDFVRNLQHLIQQNQLFKETLYIVLDNAERLRDMESNILPAFLRLQQLTKANITVILISKLVWEKFYFGTGFLNPIKIPFPNYTQKEIIEILSSFGPKEYSQEFYTSYIKLLLGVFFVACRNLCELQYMAAVNFSAFVEPIKSGKATENSTKILWRNIEPHLKKALHTIYMHEVSSRQWEEMQKETSSNPLKHSLIMKSNVELPFYSKYLLIAAYLASYNPAKTDKRFFMKHHGKIRKTAKSMKRNERVSLQLLGPKQFPLDRLMAIFYTIVEDKVFPTANLFSQITSLVSLHFLLQIGNDDTLQSPKYKCLVPLDFIKEISRTVNFDIIHYLYDFC